MSRILVASRQRFARTDRPCLVDHLLASDAGDDARFGTAIRLDGDSRVVGAYLERENGYRAGGADVFVKTSGTWAEQQKLVASDGQEEDFDDCITSVADLDDDGEIDMDDLLIILSRWGGAG